MNKRQEERNKQKQRRNADVPNSAQLSLVVAAGAYSQGGGDGGAGRCANVINIIFITQKYADERRRTAAASRQSREPSRTIPRSAEVLERGRERERLADRMGGESWVAQWRVGERQCHAREVSAGEPVQLSNCDVAGEEERKSGREGARLGRAQCSGSNSSWAQ